MEEISIGFPKTTSMWENIASNFYERWGFHNYLGAIDGKHVVIHALPNHNSLTFNYKQLDSIVLRAVADADYKFILVDIGAIFKNSTFGKAVLENSVDMPFPGPKNLPGTNESARMCSMPIKFSATKKFTAQ